MFMMRNIYSYSYTRLLRNKSSYTQYLTSIVLYNVASYITLRPFILFDDDRVLASKFNYYKKYVHIHLNLVVGLKGFTLIYNL